MTARCWALGPAYQSLSQLENALQNLSAPFSLDKLFYCSHTVGFHLVCWLMIGWEHVGYCYSFIHHRCSDKKFSHLIVHSHATETNQNTLHRRYTNVHRWYTEKGTIVFSVRRTILICLLLCICFKCLCGMTLVTDKLGNAASRRDNFCTTSPQRTPNPPLQNL